MLKNSFQKYSFQCTFRFTTESESSEPELDNQTEFLSPEKIHVHCCCGRHIFDFAIHYNPTGILFLDANVPWAFAISFFSTCQAEGVFTRTLNRKK